MRPTKKSPTATAAPAEIVQARPASLLDEILEQAPAAPAATPESLTDRMARLHQEINARRRLLYALDKQRREELEVKNEAVRRGRRRKCSWCGSPNCSLPDDPADSSYWVYY